MTAGDLERTGRHPAGSLSRWLPADFTPNACSGLKCPAAALKNQLILLGWFL
jgi:hypothetical protein